MQVCWIPAPCWKVVQHFCAGVVHVAVPQATAFGVAPLDEPPSVFVPASVAPPSVGPPELLLDAPPLELDELDEDADASSVAPFVIAASSVDPPHAVTAAPTDQTKSAPPVTYQASCFIA